MPGAEEIRNALVGAWRLTLREDSARDCFRIDGYGVVNSFFAMLLAIPVYFLTATALWRMATEFGVETNAELGTFTGAYIVGALLHWALYLFAMIPTSQRLGLVNSFGAYIVTYNWGTLFTALAMVIPFALFSLGAISGAVATMLTMPAWTLLGWYRWQIVRTVFGAEPPIALALILFDFVLNITVSQVVGWLLMPGVTASAA